MGGWDFGHWGFGVSTLLVYGIMAMEPLGPTSMLRLWGKGLTALNWMPDFLGGLIRVGFLGGRKS